MSEEPSKHLTLFSSETVNIKKLANLTANTKDYGQITRNTKPHSDPLIGLIIPCGLAMVPVTWFVSDKSPKCIDRGGLGKRRTWT